MFVDCENHIIKTLKTIRVYNITTEEYDQNNMYALPNANIDFAESMDLERAYNTMNYENVLSTKAVDWVKLYTFELPVNILLSDKTKAQVQSMMMNFFKKVGYSFLADDGTTIEISSETGDIIEAQGKLKDRFVAVIELIFKGMIVDKQDIKKLPTKHITSLTLN